MINAHLSALAHLLRTQYLTAYCLMQATLPSDFRSKL